MRVLVAGHANLETSIQVSGFPIEYAPARYPRGSRSVISGVGWNVATALAALGDDVRLLTLVGDDAAGCAVRAAAAAAPFEVVFEPATSTPLSVVLYDEAPRRAIFTDVTALDDARVPSTTVDTALAGAELAVLCNVDWTRPHIGRVRATGVPVATDLHAIEHLDSPYDQDYLREADVVFFSHERLHDPPEAVAADLQERFSAGIAGVGLGADGALLATRGHPPVRVPAPTLRPVVSTTGGGDALFSGFLHFWKAGLGPVAAMRRAVAFASWKVGTVAGSEGFLGADEVERLVAAQLSDSSS